MNNRDKQCIFLFILVVTIGIIFPLEGSAESKNIEILEENQENISFVEPKDITTKEAHRLCNNNNTIVLDVRTKKEYEKGHIPKAQWLNIEGIAFEDSLHKLNKNKEYLVYDETGKRSAIAVDAMKRAGFTKVYRAKEGITGWKKAGLSITKGK